MRLLLHKRSGQSSMHKGHTHSPVLTHSCTKHTNPHAHVQGHFSLVNHQLLRMRNGFAISSLLGRALVLPQLWCGQDRWWAPHSGEPAGAAALHEGVCWCCPSCGVGRTGGGRRTQVSLQARPLCMRACAGAAPAVVWAGMVVGTTLR